jgi:alpha-mannosidase
MYLLILFLFSLVYSSIQDRSDQTIYIHLVPHSHNDPGWIYTFEEYYEGKDPKYCVKCELDTILSSMQANKNRTFSWSEISFFKLWYQELSDEKKGIIKGLIKEKRFEIRGGAWVENDEGSVNYQGIIDQMRFGLSWLKEEFNLQVKTASLLDSFGKSVSNVK